MDFPESAQGQKRGDSHKAWLLVEHKVVKDRCLDFYRCAVCNNPDAFMSWAYTNHDDSRGPLQGEGLCG